jgi:ABC-2 type transport system permease protein
VTVRYLRLYAAFVRFSFSRAMEFRLDFFFRVWMDALWYVVNIAFFVVLFEHTELLGGWSREQVFVFAAGLFFSDAVRMTLFSNNTWWFPILVNQGSLDHYLVRPVSTLFFLSLRDFAANSFLNLLMATGILVAALLHYPGPLTLGSALAFGLLLLLGVFLQYCLHFLFLVPVFWTHSAHGFNEAFFLFERYSSRPHELFTGWVRRILVSILPFALIVSFPAQALFEGFPASILLHMVAVAAVAFVALLFVWRRGLRAYSSASS